ncbi:TPA: hypothetical protein HA318_03685 [Candidatus Micrarchaeota archaeon]|nr:hypothetical protein [Candidatus Micrarchaeota archaeon]
MNERNGVSPQVLLVVTTATIVVLAVAFAGCMGKPTATELAVSITGPDGERVSADVAVYAGETLLQQTAVTEGRAILKDLPQGSKVTLIVSKPGFEPTQTEFVAGSKPLLLLELKKATAVARVQGTADFLIVSVRNRLESKYGSQTASEIIGKMQRLAEAVETTEKLSTQVVLLDDTDSMAEFNATQLQSASEERTLAAINILVLKAKPKYLLIVGGEKIVPFQRIQNPLMHAPESDAFQFIWQTDTEVLTDNPYAIAALDSKCSDCQPDIAVGRLPDGTEDFAQGDALLSTMLDNAIAAHNFRPTFSYASKMISSDSYYHYLDRLPFETDSQFAIVPPAFGVKLIDLSYNPGSSGELHERFKSNTVFLSVHGNEPLQEQALEGRERGSIEGFLVLNPGLADSIDYDGKIVLADSCYGANPLREKKQSIPILFLEKKARFFAGSTMTALSDNRITYETADEAKIRESGTSNAFTYFFLKAVSSGSKAGDAFVTAKRQLDLNKEVNQLTLLEYVLYGDPTLSAGRRA